MKNPETVLTIDTSDRDKIFLSVTTKGKRSSNIHKSKITTSQILLRNIDILMQKNKISISDLNEIQIHTGPGSFTGLRVGIAVANTLSWLLGIKVNGKKGKLVEPIY